MKKTMVILAAILCCAVTAAADEYVNGYSRKDGTYVEGHYRTSPNSNPYDNYSSKGNTNPYTGGRGYEQPSTSNFDSRDGIINNQYGRPSRR